MGFFDILPDGQQVKCWWNVLMDVSVGDKVLEVNGVKTYSIALVEGGYACIYNCYLLGVEKKPLKNHPIFNKWGKPQVKFVEYDKQLELELDI